MTGAAPGVPAVAEALAQVRARLAAAGGDPERIRVVAVTKGQGVDAVEAARAAGLADIGENYAQELIAKRSALGERASGLRFHFLGSVQRNKVRALAGAVDTWQGVDRIEEGEAIARHAPGARVMVQVRLAGGAERGGCPPGSVPVMVEGLRALGLEVTGLMAVGPPGPPEEARAGFRWVARQAARMGLPEVSLGMSADLEVAVEEGSTMVRVGTALFGPRPGRPEMRR